MPGRYPNDRHVALTQGAYTSRSLIAEVQRCVNLYPEPNPQDAEAPMTHYPVPGLRVLSRPPRPDRARGEYRATNDQLFVVLGTTVYYVDGDFFWHRLGSLLQQWTTPVSMVDNGQTLLIVDGSAFGYQVDLASHVLTQITDSNFLGADRIDFLSTFVVSNVPGTSEYQSTLSGAPLTWNGLYIASKIGFPDPLQTLIVMHLEIWLLGRLTTEIWYNAGGANFPFALFPGTFIEHGCVAKYSVAKHDLRVFWLSQDKDGRAVVVMGESYKAVRISTFSIEEAFAKYTVISDAIADIYQARGHIFYRLHFPTADATWVFDLQVGLWHEIESIDGQGAVHRARDCFATAAYGKNVSLDWNTGDLYELSFDVFDDAGSPRVWRRGWPHILSNGSRMNFFSFAADIEAGDAASDPNVEAELYLRWSDDRGKTWSEPVGQSIGLLGKTLTQPKWWRLGQARDRVFELYWSVPVLGALNGAWIDAMPLVS